MNVRLRTPSDQPRLEQFLAQHRDSSMFLRANARRAGLEYRGELFQATYVAVLDNENVVACMSETTLW